MSTSKNLSKIYLGLPNSFNFRITSEYFVFVVDVEGGDRQKQGDLVSGDEDRK
jgi:hypothetical protein